MTLDEFLKEVNGNVNNIVCYEGREALEVVKLEGHALRYVKDQTAEICLKAVRENGYALQFVKEQTPEICLEAVKQNRYALQYVDKRIFNVCI